MYTLAVAIGAFLLFVVQPLAAKWVLPWFGGAPAVWAACLVFFQTAVLLGYAWAAWLAALPVRRQMYLHGGLLGVSLAVGLALPPEGPLLAHLPVLGIWLTLGASIGLPAVALATTSPLLQAWFAASHPGRNPYRLAVASNLGSFAALVAYVLLVEPWSSGATQVRGFLIAFALYAVGVALCGRGRCAATEAPKAEAWGGRWRWEWLVLPAVGSLLLSSTTTIITQELAPVPFLWILPLALYLVTWVLAFAQDRYPRTFVLMLVLVTAILAALGSGETRGSMVNDVGLRLLAMFGGCWFCHGEFARLRPDPRGLGGFYLAGSVGGMLGSLAAVLAAPLLLPVPVEDRVALLGVLALALVTSAAVTRASRVVATLLVVVAIAMGMIAPRYGRPNLLMRDRTFFGSLTVDDLDVATPLVSRREFRHGATVHGLQMLDERLKHRPTAYYGETSGAGKLLLSPEPTSRRVGVVGLGVGTLAAYAWKDDTWVFYELDPAVEGVARKWFTFLADCPANVDVRTGDARLTMERESEQRFDILILDAFSSGSIPWHLLTREAFALYRRHVVQGGIIAVHTSNQWLDLRGAVAASAEAAGFTRARVFEDYPRDDQHPRCIASTWMLLCEEGGAFDRSKLRDLGSKPPPGDVWSDDYVNLLGTLRR